MFEEDSGLLNWLDEGPETFGRQTQRAGKRPELWVVSTQTEECFIRQG